MKLNTADRFAFCYRCSCNSSLPRRPRPSATSSAPLTLRPPVPHLANTPFPCPAHRCKHRLEGACHEQQCRGPSRSATSINSSRTPSALCLPSPPTRSRVMQAERVAATHAPISSATAFAAPAPFLPANTPKVDAVGSCAVTKAGAPTGVAIATCPRTSISSLSARVVPTRTTSMSGRRPDGRIGSSRRRRT